MGMESGEIRKNTRLNIYSDEEVQVSIIVTCLAASDIAGVQIVLCSFKNSSESFLAYHAFIDIITVTSRLEQMT